MGVRRARGRRRRRCSTRSSGWPAGAGRAARARGGRRRARGDRRRPGARRHPRRDRRTARRSAGAPCSPWRRSSTRRTPGPPTSPPPSNAPAPTTTGRSAKPPKTSSPDRPSSTCAIRVRGAAAAHALDGPTRLVRRGVAVDVGVAAPRSRGGGRGGWRASRDGRLVRSTSLAPRRRASSSAARLSASPMPWPRAPLVDDDVLDPRLQPGRDRGTRRASGCRRCARRRGRRTAPSPAIRRSPASTSRPGGGDDDDSCGIRRAKASTSSSVDGRRRSRCRRGHGSRIVPTDGAGLRCRPIDGSRRAQLGSVLEPIVGQVYFSPECHRELRGARLRRQRRASSAASRAARRPGLLHEPRQRARTGAAARSSPPRSACSTRRSSCRASTLGWTKHRRGDDLPGPHRRRHRPAASGSSATSRTASSGPTSCSPAPSSRCARRAAALYAGLAALGIPDDHAGRGRGGAATCCASTAATATSRRGSSAGLDATEIGLLTELYWGLPLRSYSRTRAWTDEQFDAATERLESRGLHRRRCASPTAGRELREAHRGGDRPCRCAPAIDALGDDVDELFAILAPWGVAIRDAKGYPASGPHDLASATAREVG